MIKKFINGSLALISLLVCFINIFSIINMRYSEINYMNCCDSDLETCVRISDLCPNKYDGIKFVYPVSFKSNLDEMQSVLNTFTKVSRSSRYLIKNYSNPMNFIYRMDFISNIFFPTSIYVNVILISLANVEQALVGGI